MRIDRLFPRPTFMLLSMLLLGLALSACDFTTLRDEFRIRVGLEPTATVISGQFVDAATGEPLMQRVRVTVAGPSASVVVDDLQRRKTAFETENGFLTIALADGTEPRPEAPVDLKVIAHADGYVSTSAPLLIGKTGGVTFTVPMVKLDAPPEGVVVTRHTTGQATSDGVVVATVRAETPVEPGTGTRATVTLPEGTRIRDANGRLLQGALTTTVAYFSNQAESSLRAFPGGFSVTTEEGGLRSNGVFVTAGFLAVEITDAQGRQAKTFETAGAGKASTDDFPLQFEMEVPGGSLNPETDQPIAEGDSVGVWSLDLEDGTWTDEGQVRLEGPDANGNYKAVYRVNHLSFWNLDWKVNSCDVGMTLTIRGAEGHPLFIRMTGIGWNFVRTQHLPANDHTITFLRAPAGRPVRIEVYLACGALLGTIDLNDLCGGDAVLNVTLPPLGGCFVVKAKGFCPGEPPVDVLPPTVPVWYRKAGACWTFAGVTNQGDFRLCGLEPGTYDIRWFKCGTWEAQVELRDDFSIEPIAVPTNPDLGIIGAEVRGDTLVYNVELPPEICAGL